MSKQVNTLDIVLKAVEFAAHKHRNQRRKDAPASPYINHPIAARTRGSSVPKTTDSTLVVPRLAE